jgi:hypothetical protein
VADDVAWLMTWHLDDVAWLMTWRG